MLLALILLQAAAGPAAIDFDLRKVGAGKSGCPSGATTAAGEIVVCGKRRPAEADRVAANPAQAEGLPRAEFGLIGRVRGKLSAEQGEIAGITTNRAMVTVIIPF